jgi:hypothetical protein
MQLQAHGLGERIFNSQSYAANGRLRNAVKSPVSDGRSTGKL